MARGWRALLCKKTLLLTFSMKGTRLGLFCRYFTQGQSAAIPTELGGVTRPFSTCEHTVLCCYSPQSQSPSATSKTRVILVSAESLPFSHCLGLKQPDLVAKVPTCNGWQGIQVPTPGVLRWFRWKRKGMGFEAIH